MGPAASSSAPRLEFQDPVDPEHALLAAQLAERPHPEKGDIAGYSEIKIPLRGWPSRAGGLLRHGFYGKQGAEVFGQVGEA